MADSNAASLVLIGRNFEVSGTVTVGPGERVSDHLNQPRSMLILEGCEVETTAPFVTHAADIAVNRADVLMAIPVEETSPDEEYGGLLIPKPRRRARLLVGDWVVDGDLHISADGSVERFVNTGTTEFIPVTDCVLTGPDGARRLPLVLISRSHLAAIAGAPED